ncbi:MAG: isocitrate lyase/phosphoenolpyruvate mutase family protein [Candidatus Acidiferrum sp.]
MRTQKEKGEIFRALHARERAFIIPNPWDIGTSRLLDELGFEALATTSAGYAFSVGKLDNTVDRLPVMEHVTALASVSDLPVSADLGNGFGDAPEIIAESIRLAADAGAVGGSIEDAAGRADHRFYDHEHAADRIRAAVEAARALPFPFTLTARAENYLYGKPDLKDTIRRLQLYQSAGADVLYAPGIVSRDDIAAMVSSVDRPVNVLVGLPGADYSLNDLSAMGVRRVSVGSALCRAALGAFMRAAREMREKGTFTFAAEAVSSLSSLFQP